jgi:hypothetical protein
MPCPWTYGGHPVVTGGRPTPQLRVGINDKSAGFAVPDTGASWTVVPHSIAQQHRLRVDQSIKVSLRAANGHLMPVVGRTTFLLSALGLAKSTSAKVQALVCPGVSKIYVGWEALVALGAIPAAFPEPLCAGPPSALDANSHQEPKRTPKSASGVVRSQTSPTTRSDDGDSSRPVRSTKTSVVPETSKCRQEAPVSSTCRHRRQTRSGGFLREGHPASCKRPQESGRSSSCRPCSQVQGRLQRGCEADGRARNDHPAEE